MSITSLQLPSSAQSRQQTREHWMRDVRCLVNQAEAWSSAQSWSSLVEDVQLTEEAIGAYVVPVLTIQVGVGRLILEPIACRIPEAHGRVDFYAYPSLSRVLLLREFGPVQAEWTICTTDGLEWPASWSEQTFYDISKKLLRTL